MFSKTVMIRFAVAVLMIGGALVPSFAQDTVPYAHRPSAGNTYVPALGDIMDSMLVRHFKLWQSGKLENWELTAYELGQIWGSVNDAAQFYRNIPIEKIKMIDQPLIALDDAIKAKDSKRFGSAFSSLTSACNSCHEAAHVDFVVIQTPTATPFSNQSFTPKPK